MLTLSNWFYARGWTCSSSLAFLKRKNSAFCSNDSLADHSLASCQFLKRIWWEFTPCCVEHLQQGRLDWWTDGQTALSSSAGSRPRDCTGHFLTGRILADCLTFKHLGRMFWVVTLLKDGSDPGLALSAGWLEILIYFLKFHSALSKCPIWPSPSHPPQTIMLHFLLFSQFWELYWKTSK